MSVFRFKQFYIRQADNAMKVGTDAMVLGALVDTSGKIRGLDIGAGTGVLALMMAQKNDALRMDAVELDELSSKECQVNFDLSPWKERLTAVHGDFLTCDFKWIYDLIVSNPPYYQSTLENSDQRKAAARHVSALPVQDLMEKVGTLLAPDGTFWVIVPFEDKASWEEATRNQGMFVVNEVQVLGKKDATPKRCILTIRQNRTDHTTVSQLTVRDENGAYSAEYIAMTKDFHFNDLSR